MVLIGVGACDGKFHTESAVAWRLLSAHAITLNSTSEPLHLTPNEQQRFNPALRKLLSHFEATRTVKR